MPLGGLSPPDTSIKREITMHSPLRVINPTTVIALFAGLSEASAATVMPYLDGDTRQIYIWFLIAFPSALVIMFFLTLNFNHSALYPPARSCNSVHLLDVRAASGSIQSDLDFPDATHAKSEIDPNLRHNLQSKSADLVGRGDATP